jgi:hypothetical protein
MSCTVPLEDTVQMADVLVVYVTGRVDDADAVRTKFGAVYTRSVGAVKDMTCFVLILNVRDTSGAAA